MRTRRSTSCRPRRPSASNRMRLATLLLLAACACGGNAPQKPPQRLNRWGKPLSARPVPDWVDKFPESSKARVVAVGRSGPTFWPQDAMNNAREDALLKVEDGIRD